jgi:hypothetical protein
MSAVEDTFSFELTNFEKESELLFSSQFSSSVVDTINLPSH